MFGGRPTWETIGLEKKMTIGLTCNDVTKIQTPELL
jgi:hypothetical protein